MKTTKSSKCLNFNLKKIQSKSFDVCFVEEHDKTFEKRKKNRQFFYVGMVNKFFFTNKCQPAFSNSILIISNYKGIGFEEKNILRIEGEQKRVF